MVDRKRHLIIDDNGLIWSSDEYDSFEEGSRILAAVEAGDSAGYKDEIGTEWSGDLVLVRELQRTR